MTERLTLTRAKPRRRIAEIIAAELAKVSGATVTTTEEGANGGFGPRRRTVQAEASGVAVKVDCDGDLPDFLMAHWYFTAMSTDNRRLSPRFAHMIGGTVNTSHWQKATGPCIGRDRLGFTHEREAFAVADVQAFAGIIRRALQDVAEGGCFQPQPAAVA